MRVKSDYMGNDQLLPAYNLQAAVCDEYIAVIDAKPYASDIECFVPPMEKYNATYGHYPKYPVADAGYDSYNNYLYCEEHGMEKYMKFTMFDKETKDSNITIILLEWITLNAMKKGISYVQMENDFYINMISMSVEINMVGQKKSMNVKIAPIALTKVNVAREHQEIALPD